MPGGREGVQISRIDRSGRAWGQWEGRNPYSHERNHRRTVRCGLEGGEGDSLTRSSGRGSYRARRTVWRAPIGLSDRVAAPSTAKNVVLTVATFFSLERAMGTPWRGPKISIESLI